jgi:hypothetical protein
VKVIVKASLVKTVLPTLPLAVPVNVSVSGEAAAMAESSSPAGNSRKNIKNPPGHSMHDGCQRSMLQ